MDYDNFKWAVRIKTLQSKYMYLYKLKIIFWNILKNSPINEIKSNIQYLYKKNSVFFDKRILQAKFVKREVPKFERRCIVSTLPVPSRDCTVAENK